VQVLTIITINARGLYVVTICMLWSIVVETDCPTDQSLGRHSVSNTGSTSNEKKKKKEKIFWNIESQYTI